MKFPLHNNTSIDELLALSDEQLGKELRLMLENVKNGYQATKIIIPYSTSDNYCLAFVAVKQSHDDTFLSD